MDAEIFLLPSLTDLRKQREAHTLLGKLLDRTWEKQLREMGWTITTTGTLIGSPFWRDSGRGRRIFDAWVAELDLRRDPERSYSDAISLAARGNVGGVYVVVQVELESRT